MTAERFLSTVDNASSPPSLDVPENLASFMLAAERVHAEAAERARVLARAHQGAATQRIGGRTSGEEVDDHPRMRGWLADETHLVRLAALTSTALDVLARLHLSDDRRKVAARPAGSTSDETRPPKRRMVR